MEHSDYHKDILLFNVGLLVLYVLVSSTYKAMNWEREPKETPQHVTTCMLWVLLMNTTFLWTHQMSTQLYRNYIYLASILFTPIIMGYLVKRTNGLQFHLKEFYTSPFGLFLSVFIVILLSLGIQKVRLLDPIVARTVVPANFVLLFTFLAVCLVTTKWRELQFPHYMLFAWLGLFAMTNKTILSPLFGGICHGIVLHGISAYREQSFHRPKKRNKIKVIYERRCV